MHIEYKKLRLKAVWLLVAFAFLCLSSAKAETVTEVNINDYSGDTYEITTAGNFKITGNGETTSKNIKVNVDGTVNITIKNVNISTNGSHGAPFDITKGTVNLTLSGNNALIATGNQKAGLHVATNTSLTITEESNGGTLRAQGHQGNYAKGGAGIGSNRNETAGSITIKGGTIRAEHGDCAAGIGGGFSGNAFTITINGGHITAITHAAMGNPASIGGGGGGDGGTISITGGTVITLYEGNTPTIGAIGHGADKSTTSVTITGGSVYYDPTIRSKTPTDGTNNVVKKEISSLPANAKVTSLENATGYNVKDVYADKDGKVYLWLPETSNVSVKSSLAPFPLTVTINKDGSEWENHGKVFTAKKDNAGEEISQMNGFFYLEDGSYTLYADGETTNQTFTVSEATSQNVTLNYYTVTYNSNDGTSSSTVKVYPAGTNITTDNDVIPTRTYYTFDGWGETTTATEKVTITSISEAKTLYAIWKPATFTTKSSITVETTYGTAYEHTFIASELSDDITSKAGGFSGIALKEGSLPAGLSLSSSKVSGTPTTVNESGTSVTFTVTATNGATADVTITFKVKKATLTVSPTANQSIYKEEADTYVPSFSFSGVASGETAAFTGKLAWDSNTKAFTSGTLALADNDSFQKDNYELKLADEPGTIEIKTEEELSATPSSVSSVENNWYTGDITLTAPTGFKIKGNDKVQVRTTEEWLTSITISEEGDYSYSYSLLRDGQKTPVDKTFAVKLDKTLPTLSATSNKLSYTLTFGDGTNGSGIAKLLVDDQEITLAADATTYTATSTAGQHKAKVIDNAGHATEVEFTLKKDTPPYIPPVDPTPTPVYYTVTLPAVEGAATDPVAGEHEVESWTNFRFSLTLDSAYNQSVPVVTTDRGETLTPRQSDGAYILNQVRSDVEIYISGIVKNPDPVANEAIKATAAKVWITNNHLHLQSPVDADAYIYTAAGNQQAICHLTAGQQETIQLPAGIYFVRIGNERFKVRL